MKFFAIIFGNTVHFSQKANFGQNFGQVLYKKMSIFAKIFHKKKSFFAKFFQKTSIFP